MESERCETLHTLYPSLVPLKLEDIIELERKGITVIKNKRFTAEEDKRIKKNFKRFFKKHDIEIDDEIKKMALGYFDRSKNVEYAKKKKEMKRFLDKNKFFLSLGKRIENRSIHSIYQRARKILSPLIPSKMLSIKEKKSMIKMKKNDINLGWTQIAECFDADPKSVNHLVDSTIDRQGKQLQKGPFDRNEEICLVKAIMLETNAKNIDDVFHESIPWENVRKHLKGRNRRQCFLHWSNLRSRIDSYVKPFLLNEKPYTDFDSARLIYILYKERMNYNNDSDIDWDWIKTKFCHVGSLDIIIRWWKTLASEVPEKRQTSHFKLIKWLYKKKLPSLMGDKTYEDLQEFYERGPDCEPTETDIIRMRELTLV